MDMDIKKWVPWNWFRKEEENTGATVPVQQKTAQEGIGAFPQLFSQLHNEMDQRFEQMFREFGMGPPRLSNMANGMLKPTLDLSASENEYIVNVEIPGVDEKNLKIEVEKNTMIIRGEKKQEKEEKEKSYYRQERFYGSFQRILSLPEDADQDGIKATFKQGVLNITMPRKALPKADVRQIAIKTV
ncbi:Hsp20/alpha crystallin family protein [Candidatus Electrothrix sp.]|uniref:Hsp20/alpha crystallin family protein n=1 Tax=Candidatus Electrothrix sp. TaxID=2170559 RepID=UPI004055C343